MKFIPCNNVIGLTNYTKAESSFNTETYEHLIFLKNLRFYKNPSILKRKVGMALGEQILLNFLKLRKVGKVKKIALWLLFK